MALFFSTEEKSVCYSGSTNLSCSLIQRKWFSHLVESKLDVLKPAEVNHFRRLKVSSWNSFLATVNSTWACSVIAFSYFPRHYSLIFQALLGHNTLEILPIKKYKSDSLTRFKPCKEKAEKRSKEVGFCLELKNRPRLLGEFLFLSPVIAAPLALFNRTVETKAVMSNTTPRNRF